jgi:ABC-type sugar transport system ATPase subunit
MVLDDPTAGVDVGAREQVHSIIERGLSDSMGILLISTDSEELVRLCDRVLIMSKGWIVDELHRGSDLTVQNVDHAQVTGKGSRTPDALAAIEPGRQASNQERLS